MKTCQFVDDNEDDDDDLTSVNQVLFFVFLADFDGCVTGL